MKNIYILISLVLIQMSAKAQIPASVAARAGGGATMNQGHFYGKIVDESNKGIDGVTLQIKGSKFDPITKKTTEAILGTMLTAANGDFSFENLPVMGNLKLVISAIGYKKIENTLSFNIKMGGGQSMQQMMAMVDKDLGNIKLEEDPTDLKSVTVTSTARPQFEMGIDRKIFNVEKNIVYTGQGNQHPGLFKKALFIANDEVHWIREDLSLKEGDKMEVMARIRYRQPLQKAILHQFKDGMYVVFENPQSAITEGQFVAWHLNDEVLGSGVIA